MSFRCILWSVRLVGIFTILLSSAFAWDPLGHMIVDEMAYRRLSPDVREKVNASIKAFNTEHKTDYDMITAGCWMDDIRGQTREFNAWHYIDLPFTENGQPFPDGTTPNVLWAMQLCSDIITGKTTHQGIDKNQALIMLIHLVGDAHQPLHATNNDDAGGNRVLIKNLEDPALAVFKTRPNLHFVWDSAYRLKFQKDTISPAFPVPLQTLENPVAGHRRCMPLVRAQVDEILKEFPPDTSPALNTPEAWISESHSIGYASGYQSLPGGPYNRSVIIDETYFNAARATTRQRLAMGGQRLADLLNELYK